MSKRLMILLGLLLISSGSIFTYVKYQQRPSADIFSAPELNLFNPCTIPEPYYNSEHGNDIYGPIHDSNGTWHFEYGGYSGKFGGYPKTRLGELTFGPPKVRLGDTFSASVGPFAKNADGTDYIYMSYIGFPSELDETKAQTLGEMDIGGYYGALSVNGRAVHSGPSIGTNYTARAIHRSSEDQNDPSQPNWERIGYGIQNNQGLGVGQGWLYVYDDQSKISLSVPDAIDGTLRRFTKDANYNYSVPVASTLTNLPAGVADDYVMIHMRADGRGKYSKDLGVDGVTQAHPGKIAVYYNTDGKTRDQLHFSAITSQLCNSITPTDVTVVYETASLNQQSVDNDPQPVDGTVLTKVTAKVVDSDTHQPLSNVAVRWGVASGNTQVSSASKPNQNLAQMIKNVLVPRAQARTAINGDDFVWHDYQSDDTTRFGLDPLQLSTDLDGQTSTTDVNGEAVGYVRWSPAKSANTFPTVGAHYTYHDDSTDQSVTLTGATLPPPTLSCLQTIPNTDYQSLDDSDTPPPTITKTYTAGTDQELTQPFDGTLDCTVTQKNPTTSSVTITPTLNLTTWVNVNDLGGGTRGSDGSITWPDATIPPNSDKSWKVTGIKWLKNQIDNATSPPTGA